MNSLVWLVLDSCRYDSFVAAQTPAFDRFVEQNETHVERRFSYASWSGPSHYAFLSGLVPHASPPGQFAAQVYEQDFARWTERLGTDIDYRRFVPNLWLPHLLHELGYRNVARVSVPVLNEATVLATDFDDYRLMDDHNDFGGMINELQFPCSQPMFYLLNLGETHYPYMLAEADLPHLSGVHGTAQRMGDEQHPDDQPQFFDTDILDRFHAQQIRCVEHIDGVFSDLLAKCPVDTHFIVTSDHGELFGEDDYFGHGPIMHEKVFEVPFLEGKAFNNESSPDDELRARVLARMQGLGYVN